MHVCVPCGCLVPQEIRRGYCVLWHCGYGWLWTSMLGKGGITAQGWNPLLSVSLGSCFSPSIRTGSGGRRKLPLSFLSSLFVCVSNKTPSVGWCPQHSWHVVFPLSAISGNTPSCTPPTGQCLPCFLIQSSWQWISAITPKVITVVTP